jgi:hypothetical protein
MESLMVLPYEELNISTMTLIMTLKGEIDIQAAFQLLPITRIQIYKARESSKCKLPHCSTPGAILSMKYRGCIRGIIRNKTRPFKNAVTIDISTFKKNINLKLSSSSIHMCGASSLADGIEAATHIMNHVRHIQEILNKIQNNLSHTLYIIEWIKMVTKGPSQVQKILLETREYNNITMNIVEVKTYNTIIKSQIPFPLDFNTEIANFLLSLCDDFIYHEDLCMKLDFIPKISNITSDNLEIENINEVMVNHNYFLGFRVNRDMLDKLMKGRNGFLSRYDNELGPAVIIELPYSLSDTEIKRRRNKVPHNTFLVYSSGAVTQSGSGTSDMKGAYHKFIATIHEILPFIQDIDYSSLSDEQKRIIAQMYEDEDKCTNDILVL